MAPDPEVTTAMDGAMPQLRSEADAQIAARPDATAAPASGCQNVIMSFSVCALEPATPGVPRLQAGRAYTVRARGPYGVDTTFQLDGATTACTSEMFGTLTLAAGVRSLERCIMPNTDVALRLTVISGDAQVWMSNAVLAEVCDGCE